MSNENETIFFPMSPGEDVRLPHSWISLTGKRFCFGKIITCPFCIERDVEEMAQ